MVVAGDRSSWLQQHAADWVRAKLISEAQADAILHFEHIDEPAAPPRLTIVAEIASYLGSVIAFAGGAAVIAPNWEGLGLFGQATIALAIASVGFVTGTWTIRQGEIGTERLGGFLWIVGTGGVALAIASVVNEIEPDDDAWLPALVGIAVLLLGAGLWRNLDRPLQLSTTGTGLLVAGGGIAALAELSVWIVAPCLWVLSCGFGALAASHRVRPRLLALASSATGLMIGAFMVMEESERLGAVAAVVSATLIVAYALSDRSWPLVAIGLIAFFVAVTTLMATVLEGVLARLIAVALGLVVVAVVAGRAQRTSRAASGPRRQPLTARTGRADAVLRRHRRS